MNTTEYDHLFKVLMVGDSGVGKSRNTMKHILAQLALISELKQ